MDEEAHLTHPTNIKQQVISPLILFCGRNALQWVKWGERCSGPARNSVNFSPRAVKSADIRVESDQNCAIAPVLYLRHAPMIEGGALKKSYAGFVHLFLVWRGYDWILEGDSQVLRAIEKRIWVDTST